MDTNYVLDGSLTLPAAVRSILLLQCAIFLAFMHMSLFVEFSLEMMSKLLKKFQNDQVNLSGTTQS